jgi:hypothetical protein
LTSRRSPHPVRALPGRTFAVPGGEAREDILSHPQGDSTGARDGNPHCARSICPAIGPASLPFLSIMRVKGLGVLAFTINRAHHRGRQTCCHSVSSCPPEPLAPLPPVQGLAPRLSIGESAPGGYARNGAAAAFFRRPAGLCIAKQKSRAPAILRSAPGPRKLRAAGRIHPVLSDRYRGRDWQGPKN